MSCPKDISSIYFIHVHFPFKNAALRSKREKTKNITNLSTITKREGSEQESSNTLQEISLHSHGHCCLMTRAADWTLLKPSSSKLIFWGKQTLEKYQVYWAYFLLQYVWDFSWRSHKWIVMQSLLLSLSPQIFFFFSSENQRPWKLQDENFRD